MMGKMPVPGQQEEQAAQGGGNAIQDTDQMLGAIGKGLISIPGGGEQFSQRMAKVQAEYRKIIEDVMAAQGGGQAQGQQMPQAAPKASPVPDRGMGTPMSPAGPYG